MSNTIILRHHNVRTKSRRRKPCLCFLLARHLFPVLVLVVLIQSAGLLINFNSYVVLEQPSSPNASANHQASTTPRVVFLDGRPRVRSKRPRSLEDDMWLQARYTRHRFSLPVNATDGAVPLKGRKGDCVTAAEWQSRFYPTCNSFHELGFQLGKTHGNNQDKRSHGNEKVSMEFLGSGKSRDAWKVTEYENAVVLKTLQVSGFFSHLTYHFQIVDAIAAERLSASKYVIDIFGFCGASVMNEIGIAHEVKEHFTLSEKLGYARDIAGGMADMHEIGGGFPKLVHGDLRRGNVMFSQDRKTLKISDFNLGFFLGWDITNSRPCGYKRESDLRARQRDKFSSPEETFGQVLTEKTDIYHLGGMLFYLLNGGKPFIYNDSDDMDDAGNPKIKEQWTLPVLSKKLQESKDPAVLSMWNVVQACLQYKAKKRPTAREVFNRLRKTIESNQQAT